MKSQFIYNTTYRIAPEIEKDWLLMMPKILKKVKAITEKAYLLKIKPAADNAPCYALQVFIRDVSKLNIYKTFYEEKIKKLLNNKFCNSCLEFSTEMEILIL